MADSDVSLSEVARALGISRSTAWVRVIRGTIPSRRVAGRYVVRRHVLERLVREQADTTVVNPTDA